MLFNYNELFAKDENIQIIDFSTISDDGLVLDRGWKFRKVITLIMLCLNIMTLAGIQLRDLQLNSI
jgi:hypothetical protein